MIPVNRSESLCIRKRFPDLYIVRTCKQHPRKSTWYVPEIPEVLKYLDELRGTVNGEYVSKFDGYGVTDN